MRGGPSDRHAISVKLVIFVVAALTGAEIGKVMHQEERTIK
jgi:hypothetical protein